MVLFLYICIVALREGIQVLYGVVFLFFLHEFKHYDKFSESGFILKMIEFFDFIRVKHMSYRALFSWNRVNVLKSL